MLIDGIDIAGVSLKSLRRQIGLVTQDTVMFHATIGENIAYGKRRARREEVLAAAEKAFVDEFVHQLPDGYDTMVGEHGATLSGGQKQRIAIARAILRDPAILIFDEAMSQVDADSENRIHQALAEFAKGRTTLLIAHRFATVLAADHIVVMNAGAIIDSGTHAGAARPLPAVPQPLPDPVRGLRRPGPVTSQDAQGGTLPTAASSSAVVLAAAAVLLGGHPPAGRRAQRDLHSPHRRRHGGA